MILITILAIVLFSGCIQQNQNTNDSVLLQQKTSIEYLKARGETQSEAERCFRDYSFRLNGFLDSKISTLAYPNDYNVLWKDEELQRIRTLESEERTAYDNCTRNAYNRLEGRLKQIADNCKAQLKPEDLQSICQE